MSENRKLDVLPNEDLADLYENAPCGYLSSRPDGRIIKVNRTFSDWFGYDPDELIGQRFSDLLNIAGRIFYETHFAPLLRMQGFFNEVALDILRKDRRVIPVLVNAREVRSTEGAALFIRFTVFNATDRRRYEHELLAAKARAEELSRELGRVNAELEKQVSAEHEEAILREQFIAVLGHDLRNPLAAIAAGVHLLGRKSADPSVEIVPMMKAGVFRMSTLIDNILDFARGRLGAGIQLSFDDLRSLRDTLEQVVGEFRLALSNRPIVTAYALPDPVRCDHARIAQLVSNLLGNALTYGDPGAPVFLKAETKPGQLEIFVANSGPEIPPEARGQLFQPFFRGEVRGSRQGLGLGLHIAAEIARAHGGTIEVASSTEETRFTLKIPQPSRP